MTVNDENPAWSTILAVSARAGAISAGIGRRRVVPVVEASFHAASPLVVRWLPGHCAPDPRSREVAPCSTSVPWYRARVLETTAPAHRRPPCPASPSRSTARSRPEWLIACTLHPNDYRGRLADFLRDDVFAHLTGMQVAREPARLRLLLDAGPTP